MDRKALEAYNVSENLDQLMNLDPRGYGVCRILYAESRKAMGEALSLHAARYLLGHVRAGEHVYILTGFVLLAHERPETDGLVSALLLARALVEGLDAKPVIVCPEICLPALSACAPVVGLHLYDDLSLLEKRPLCMGVSVLPTTLPEAESAAEALLGQCPPACAVSIEAPGQNALGRCHNAAGKDVTALEARFDCLWSALRARAVPTISIGDLGNEIGMGTIGAHVRSYIPCAAPGECACSCGGGILASSSADCIITATCSDWGCYALIAALAYLLANPRVMHEEEMQSEVLKTAARCGVVDMTGSLLPGVDGFDAKLYVSVYGLMRQCVAYALSRAHEFEQNFSAVLAKHFYR